MTSDLPDERKPFGWRTRLKYGLLAAAAAWLAGWIIAFPFELLHGLALCGRKRPPVARCPGQGIGGMGRVQSFHGHGRFRADGSAGVPAHLSALVCALAPHPDPRGSTGSPPGYRTDAWGF